MASKNLQIAYSESSGDSGSAESNKTNNTNNPNNYKCIECFKPFPNRVMLIQHQNEDENCRRSHMMKTITINPHNPLSFSQHSFYPLPSPSPLLSSSSISGPNLSTLELLSPMLSSSSPPPSQPPRAVQPNPINLAPYPTFFPLSPSIAEFNSSILAPSIAEFNSSILAPSLTLPPPSQPPRAVEPNPINFAPYQHFLPLSPSIVEFNTPILAPSPTLPPPSLRNVNSYVPSFAPGLAPLPSPIDAGNATSYHHAYLMRDFMSNDAAPAPAPAPTPTPAPATATAYGEDDHSFSPDNRTLDLISQLDPTRNFLCLIDQQSEEQIGHNVNDADAAPGPSVEMEPLDLNFKI